MTSKESTKLVMVKHQRNHIPHAYRSIYDRAIGGKSLRSSINAQCLECVCWKKEEVKNCTDFGCPLYAVRPYQQISQTASKGRDIRAKSNKEKVMV